MHPRLPVLLAGFAALLLVLGHALPPFADGQALRFLPPWDIPALLSLLAGGVLARRPPPQKPQALVRPREWSLDVMRRMDWKRLENLCAAYYPTAGIQGRALHLGETGGIDVRLYQDEEDPEYATAIVRCKSSHATRVDGKTIL